jgi:hypothetical protein
MKKVILDCRTGIFKNTETNDCTVGALATAANIPYEQAHNIMEKTGRRIGRGGTIFRGIVHASLVGLLKYTILELPKHKRVFNAAPGFVGVNGKAILTTHFVGPSIKQFIAQHPRGRYIVKIKRHAFALIDGVMFDRYKQHAGAIVKNAWKIEPI